MNHFARGFTLIELSIVLVIIGLVVGGVLVGRELVSQAGIRSTISQLEKYQTAVNAFHEKYGALPGDLNQQTATQFGFSGRNNTFGEGDGNGLIQGFSGYAVGGQAGGETGAFWVDLTTAHLIDGGFTKAVATGSGNGGNPITGSMIDQYLPAAKLGNGNYVYVSSYNGSNYFGIESVQEINVPFNGQCTSSSPGLTVKQAAAMDTKIDDGLPQTGNVLALYAYLYSWPWAEGAGGQANGHIGAPPGAAYSYNATSTRCYNNGGVSGATMVYTSTINDGSGVNCALIFKFQ